MFGIAGHLSRVDVNIYDSVNYSYGDEFIREIGVMEVRFLFIKTEVSGAPNDCFRRSRNCLGCSIACTVRTVSFDLPR